MSGKAGAKVRTIAAPTDSNRASSSHGSLEGGGGRREMNE
jgi:hypothetical protein